MAAQHGKDSIGPCYFKYYSDYLQANGMGVDAYLAEELWSEEERLEAQEKIDLFLSGWFLDDRGADKTEMRGFSFSRVFNGTFSILLVTIAKYAGVFMKLSEKANERNESVAVFYHSPDSLPFKVADYMNKVYGYHFYLIQTQTEDIYIGDRFPVYEKSFPEMRISQFFINTIFRLLQAVFYRSFLRGKIMVSANHTDAWLEHSEVNENCLFNSSKKVKRRWVLCGRGTGYSWIDDAYEKMVNLFNERQIPRITIGGMDFSPVFIDHAARFLRQYSARITSLARQIFGAINFYRPRAVVINYETVEIRKILAQAARSLGMPVIHLLDGYGMRSLFPFDINDSKLMELTHFIEYSEQGRLHLISKGIDENKVHIMTAPLFGKALEEGGRNGKDCALEYDAVIFTLARFNYSTAHNWHDPQQYLFKALKACSELGWRRIGVKVKNRAVEEPLIKPILQAYVNALDIAVLAGSPYDCYARTSNIIGGLSTAMAEAAVLGKKYYIYQPEDSGYPGRDDFWPKDLDIAGTSDELVSNIKNGLYFCFNAKQAGQYGLPAGKAVLSVRENIISEMNKIFSCVH